MFTNQLKKAIAAIVALTFLAGLSNLSAQAAANANPRVIPNGGAKYGDLSAKWWQWALGYMPAAYLAPSGPVDISANQLGNVWFLAGTAGGAAVSRSGNVPTGRQLFFPMANAAWTYCPEELIGPAPDESLEEFLQRKANDQIPPLTDLFASIDGMPLSNLTVYRAVSPLFSMPTAVVAACLSGERPSAASAGYWLLLPPLQPGQHVLHFGTPDRQQDITYTLTVR